MNMSELNHVMKSINVIDMMREMEIIHFLEFYGVRFESTKRKCNYTVRIVCVV